MSCYCQTYPFVLLNGNEYSAAISLEATYIVEGECGGVDPTAEQTG